jgi:hypothetical protein
VVDAGQRQASHFDNGAEGVALSSALDTKQANRMRLIQVQRNRSAVKLAKNAKLGRFTSHAHDGIV